MKNSEIKNMLTQADTALEKKNFSAVKWPLQALRSNKQEMNLTQRKRYDQLNSQYEKLTLMELSQHYYREYNKLTSSANILTQGIILILGAIGFIAFELDVAELLFEMGLSLVMMGVLRFIQGKSEVLSTAISTSLNLLRIYSNPMQFFYEAGLLSVMQVVETVTSSPVPEFLKVLLLSTASLIGRLPRSEMNMPSAINQHDNRYKPNDKSSGIIITISDPAHDDQTVQRQISHTVQSLCFKMTKKGRACQVILEGECHNHGPKLWSRKIMTNAHSKNITDQHELVSFQFNTPTGCSGTGYNSVSCKDYREHVTKFYKSAESLQEQCMKHLKQLKSANSQEKCSITKNLPALGPYETLQDATAQNATISIESLSHLMDQVSKRVQTALNTLVNEINDSKSETNVKLSIYDKLESKYKEINNFITQANIKTTECQKRLIKQGDKNAIRELSKFINQVQQGIMNVVLVMGSAHLEPETKLWKYLKKLPVEVLEAHTTNQMIQLKELRTPPKTIR